MRTPPRDRRPWRRIARIGLFASAGAALWLGPAAAQAPDEPDDDLFDLPLEQLAAVPVTSVTGVARDWFQTPAAVYVISGEELRRSGHTSLVEMLRMVPGFYVGRVDSSQWATGVRGFADRFANRLQVLVDGRVVYNELFGGVYWDVQTPLLEDLDTIEVIRGPGATLWGANAVNGVVNVRSRSAADTHGAYHSGGGGNEDRAFGMTRYGFEASEGVSLRGWGRYFDRDATRTPEGRTRNDSWSIFRGGFRLDAELDEDTQLMAQGEGYTTPLLEQVFAVAEPPVPRLVAAEAQAWGGHALLRLNRQRGSPGEPDARGFGLQAYYDLALRDNVVGFDQTRHTLDLDYRHHMTVFDRHELMWGAGYRYRSTNTTPAPTLALDPSDRDSHLATFFVQDTITLVEDRLFLMLGSKFEYNTFTHFEAQPSGRIWWTPSPRHTLWAAVSRPVRIPSLVEQYLSSQLLLFVGGMPVPARIEGSANLDAERLLAVEAGYRVRPHETLTLDVAAFWFDYQDLIVAEVTDPTAVPVVARFRNQAKSENVGVEVSGLWQPFDCWRLRASYSYLHVDARNTGSQELGDRDPEHMFQIRSYLDVTDDVDFNAALYFTDRIDRMEGIPSYFRLDLGLTWRPVEHVELSVWGQNLTDAEHVESNAVATNGPVTQIQRGVYGRVALRF